MTISTRAAIQYLKILLISIGILSLFIAMKACLPLMLHDLSTVWTGLTAFLRPPYLYVIINAIIITLIYSSGFQQQQSQPDDNQIAANVPLQPDLHTSVPTVAPPVLEVKLNPVSFEMSCQPEPVVVKEDDEFEIFPAVGILFVNDNSEELGLKQAKLEPHGTLEDTWRMITEGSKTPPPATATGELKRCDKVERRRKPVALKSRTFKERTNYDPLPKGWPAVRYRKEPWLGQAELNRRVEAFIKKFNQEMRLQRQRSIQQHMEMINGGPH